MEQKEKYKTCTKCLELKPTSEFSPSISGSKGAQSWCKQCMNDKGAERREKKNERRKYATRW